MNGPAVDRMLAELRLVQEALPGMVAADSQAYLLAYLMAEGAIHPEAWRKALEALGADYPDRRAAMDAALAERSQTPLLRVVPDPLRIVPDQLS